MRLKKDSSRQKLRGAYYTPAQLADAMAGLFANKKIKSVLEPSCGDGVFLDSVVAHKLVDSDGVICGVEIEASEAEKVRKRYESEGNIQILAKDFLEFYAKYHNNKRYDLIIGNPPYIRYQYLSEKQREIQSQILLSHGMKANKLINSWVCFLVACVQMLSDNGIIAFVIPAEILQVAYAEDLRLFLTNQLDKITLITFEKLVFPEIEQEVLVFIGEKGSGEKGIRIIEMNNLADFETLNLEQNGFQPAQHIKEKWTKYFLSGEETRLIQRLRGDSRFIAFNKCGIINVGITTGNNEYFSITKETEEKYDLQSVTLPLIGRSSHSHGIFFTESDWLLNSRKNKRAMLISFPEAPLVSYPKKHQEYIKKGEDENQQIGYKCAIRDRWYVVPSVWVPDAFFLRRNNIYPKFVLNRCNAVSTDTMHRIKFYDDVDHLNVLLSYYNSISFAFTEICGRSYGGGVLEILPGEMGNILLPKITAIDKSFRDDMLKRVDTIVRAGDDIEIALDIVDRELLINILGIEEKLCEQCRSIWKKLQKRRLGRM